MKKSFYFIFLLSIVVKTEIFSQQYKLKHYTSLDSVKWRSIGVYNEADESDNYFKPKPVFYESPDYDTSYIINIVLDDVKYYPNEQRLEIVGCVKGGNTGLGSDICILVGSKRDTVVENRLASFGAINKSYENAGTWSGFTLVDYDFCYTSIGTDENNIKNFNCSLKLMEDNDLLIFCSDETYSEIFSLKELLEIVFPN